MASGSKTKMVNGRVREQSVEKAARTLAAEGLTISSFIRNSIEYVANEQVVPESGFPASSRTMDKDRIRNFLHAVKTRPMPGKQDHPGLEGDALVERIRMERYGY